MRTAHGNRVLKFLFATLLSGVMAVGLAASQTSKKTGKKATAQSGQVDLNTASEQDLDSLPGVGPTTAKKIIKGRPYSSVDDLSKAGVSARTIKKITPLVTVGGASETAHETPSAPPAASSPSYTPAQPTSRRAASSASQENPGPGMVWVNLDSGVYHYPSSRYYGKTKNGKYMSEADAMKAGYHPAKNEKKPQ